MTMDEWRAQYERIMAARRAEELRMKAAGYEQGWDAYKHAHVWRKWTRARLEQRIAAIDRRIDWLLGNLPDPGGEWQTDYNGVSSYVERNEVTPSFIKAGVDADVAWLVRGQVELCELLEAMA